MRVIKRIVAIVGTVCILMTVKCYAVLQDSENIIIKNNVEYVYKNYMVLQDEENDFLNNLEKEITINNKKYTLEDKIVTGGNVLQTKQISKTKTIISKTNNKEKVIEELGMLEEYTDNDGYIGEYHIDENSISIKTNYNGYYEYLIDDTREYNNLEKNDLEYLQKQIEKDGIILDLLSIDWKIEDTKLLGNNEIPDKYTAVCYYATKKRVDNPVTYTITASYVGEATKTEKSPLEYTLVYKIKEDIKEKNSDIPILLGVSGTTTFFVVVFLLTKANTNIYNLKNGKWVLVGKVYLSKKLKIKLDKFSHLESSSKYKIELSKKAVDNVTGKFIEIKKGDKIIRHIVKSKKDNCYFEINI